MKRNELNAASHANHWGRIGGDVLLSFLGADEHILASGSIFNKRDQRRSLPGGMARDSEAWLAGLALIPQIRLAKQATVLSLRNTGLTVRADAVRCAAPARLRSWSERPGELRLQRGHLGLHLREPGL